MAIKGGDLLHVGERVLIERAQTGGPGQVNLSPEHLYELGNYQSTGILYDIPDLSFSVESLDTSAALEALLTGIDFSTMNDGDLADPATCINLDVASEFKNGRGSSAPFDIATSVAIPYLTVESLSYRFGLRDKAAQTATLKGDSIFYNPGSTYMETFTGTATAGQTCALAHKAYPYNGDTLTGPRYALGVKVRGLDGTTRLKYGVDYTETVTGTGATKTVSVVVTASVPNTSHIDVIYASDTVATYPQNSHTVPSAVRPAAIRGRDIEVYVGGQSVGNKWTSVQSVNIDWRVQLQKDEEFGNHQLVGQDYDVPTVNGSVVVKPRDAAELYTKIAQAAGVATTAEAVGALSTTPLELMVVLHSPVDGTVLKSLVVPDARLTVPGYSGRVQNKLEVTLNFESDGGILYVYKGAAP